MLTITNYNICLLILYPCISSELAIIEHFIINFVKVFGYIAKFSFNCTY